MNIDIDRLHATKIGRGSGRTFDMLVHVAHRADFETSRAIVMCVRADCAGWMSHLLVDIALTLGFIATKTGRRHVEIMGTAGVMSVKFESASSPHVRFGRDAVFYDHATSHLPGSPL